MEQFYNFMLYQERVVLYAFAIGLIIAIAAKVIPFRILAKASTWPYCSPNWITFWGVVIFYISVGFYVVYVLALEAFNSVILLPVAIILFFISEGMDWVDGRMAKAMKLFGIPRTELSIERGQWGDPLGDKTKHLPTITALMLVTVFSPYIAIPVVLADVIGTFVRKPFTEEPYVKLGLFVKIKNNLRQSKASRIGKAKSLFQVIAIIVAVPYHLGWVEHGYLPNVILGIALPLGVLSVISRIKISRDFDKAVDEVHAVFEAESSN